MHLGVGLNTTSAAASHFVPVDPSASWYWSARLVGTSPYQSRRHSDSFWNSWSLLSHCIVSPWLWMDMSCSDRTPCTQTMMSPNICGRAFYDLCHPHLHPLLFTSVHPVCFHP